MSKTAKQILERVYNKGFNDRCQQEKYADIDNQFVFALSVDQSLKELEALIRNEKLKLLAEVRERLAEQEYPEYVMLWTPDGNERTRVIKIEDAIAELNKLEAEL